MNKGSKVYLKHHRRLNGKIVSPKLSATILAYYKENENHEEQYFVRFEDGYEAMVFPREIEERHGTSRTSE